MRVSAFVKRILRQIRRDPSHFEEGIWAILAIILVLCGLHVGIEEVTVIAVIMIILTSAVMFWSYAMKMK